MHSPANFFGVAGSLLTPNRRSKSRRISPLDHSTGFAAPSHDVVSATSAICMGRGDDFTKVSEITTDPTQRRELL